MCLGPIPVYYIFTGSVYIYIYKYIYIYISVSIKTMARDPLEFGSLFAYRVV